MVKGLRYCFRVIDCAAAKFQVKLKESMYIKNYGKSVTLINRANTLNFDAFHMLSNLVGDLTESHKQK